MVDTDSKHVLCSWCSYDVFIPISNKICMCYNCEALKTLEDLEIIPPTEAWQLPETSED